MRRKNLVPEVFQFGSSAHLIGESLQQRIDPCELNEANAHFERARPIPSGKRNIMACPIPEPIDAFAGSGFVCQQPALIETSGSVPRSA